MNKGNDDEFVDYSEHYANFSAHTICRMKQPYEAQKYVKIDRRNTSKGGH